MEHKALLKSGDRVGEADTRQDIGVTWAKQGNLTKAEEIGHPDL